MSSVHLPPTKRQKVDSASASLSSSSSLRCMVLTTNVGSCFEVPNVIEDLVEAIRKVILEQNLDFIAIFMQELGGKYSKMDAYPVFLKTIETQIFQIESHAFHHSGLIWNLDLKSQSYTAMACAFLARKSRLSDIEIWDENRFIPFAQFNAFQNSQHDVLEISSTVKSYKFPLLINNNNNTNNHNNVNSTNHDIHLNHHNPNEKHKNGIEHKHRLAHLHDNSEGERIPRKGYQSTKWRFCGQEMNLTHVHLHHDEDNTIASEKVPSSYADTRQRALKQTMSLCDISNQVPAIVAGDYNIRMDCHSFVKWLHDHHQPQIQADQSYFKMKGKEFVWKDAHMMFNDPKLRLQLLKFDKELDRFNQSEDSHTLLEQPILFGPTYCLEDEPHVKTSDHQQQQLHHHHNNHSENNTTPTQQPSALQQQSQGASNHNDGAIKHTPCEQTEEQKLQQKQRVKIYASKRIPAWCDRVTYTKEALKHIRDCNYDAIYAHATGDHMPVFLSFTLTK